MMSCSRLLCCPLLLVVVFAVTCYGSDAADDTYYSVSATPLGRMFEGIGGLSGGGATSRLLPDYVEEQRQQILDYLFVPGFGASLQILKVEIGGDAESTEGDEASHMHSEDDENYHRGYEWWLMREAKARHPGIKVAEGGSSPFTNSTARYITNWIRGARDVHGLHIDYVGLWNEKETSREYTLTLRRHLDAAKLTTHIITADGGWGICDELINDDDYRHAVYAIGAHYPDSSTSSSCTALLGQGKSLWASEDFSTGYEAGGCWSRLLSRNYAYANLTSSISWNLGSFYYDELPWGKVGLMTGSQPWSGWYDIGSVFWVTAHHTQFTRYGWHYLGHGSGVGKLQSGGTYVSLTDRRGNLTIIIETMTANVSRCQYSQGPDDPITQQDVTFQLSGFDSVQALNVFHSSMDPHSDTLFEYVGQLPVINGTVTLTVMPNDLFTLSTINGTKSTFSPPVPPATPFPFPYADDFNDRRVSGFPRYFDDQSGSFEIVAAANMSHGHVVRQMMPMMPVAWCGDAPLTFSVIGDHTWRALTVGIDVLIEDNGTAFIAADVSSGGCVGGRGSDGIVLAVSTEQQGTWILSNSTALQPVVAQGNVPVAPGQWLRLTVEVGEGGTAVSVDGQQVAMVKWLTSRQHNGWVAIGSSYDHVQFDNLSITPNTTRTAANPAEEEEDVAMAKAQAE